MKLFRKSGLSVPLKFLHLGEVVLIYSNLPFTCKMGFRVPPVTQLFVNVPFRLRNPISSEYEYHQLRILIGFLIIETGRCTWV